jgi:hypothetical protein
MAATIMVFYANGARNSQHAAPESGMSGRAGAAEELAISAHIHHSNL